MLILTRRIGESLVIENDIVITVLNIRGNQIRFGIKAPKEISVHREEIYQRIQEEQITKTKKFGNCSIENNFVVTTNNFSKSNQQKEKNNAINNP